MSDTLCRCERKWRIKLWGNVPDLPGCIAVAETLPEVKALIQEAIAFHLESLRSDGSDIPTSISLHAADLMLD